jgi:hypothetical protein
MEEFCRHCNNKVNWNSILCDNCSKKAMELLPTDPKERVQIYRLLLESKNPITKYAAEQLMKQDLETIEEQMFNPSDRYDFRSE